MALQILLTEIGHVADALKVAESLQSGTIGEVLADDGDF